ncbi:MAG: hypothetical protein COV69_00490 [Parcubacteria group bacterium CG11_big_fil_rev_8_21_14_0_20_39_14]|nr:MAG: hypothetical protein COV69_00490 [Parcubacteria group bacterium CG11_big_fil_rev_8_21_14_0_20_39_14]
MFITQGKTNWRFILIVIILAVIVGGGILAWQYWDWIKFQLRPGIPMQEAPPYTPKPCIKNEDCGMDTCQQGKDKCVEIKYICENEMCIYPAQTTEFPSPPYKCVEGKCRKEVVEDETADWKTYRNEEYGFEFEHPQEWGVLTLESQKTEEVYSFNSQNETIKTIWYHKPSGIIAFIIKGEKYKLAYEGEAYQDVLKIIYPNKEIKMIYTVPPQRVNWYGRIEDVNLSPNGKYIYFSIPGYESYDCMLVNIDSGSNIIDCNIITFNPYEDVYWSPNNKVLAIKSHLSPYLGQGTDGLFVSDYEKLEKLNEVFSLTWEEHLGGSHIYDIYFTDDGRLFFTVFSKSCEYNGEWKCQPEKTTKYDYSVQTKELKEIE